MNARARAREREREKKKKEERQTYSSVSWELPSNMEVERELSRLD